MTAPRTIASESIGVLIGALRDLGCRVVGPTRRDGAIVYDDIDGLEDLPIGWTDIQEPGRYTLQRRDDDAIFGYAVGPHSWRRELFPPRQRLWSTVTDDDTHFRIVEAPHADQRLAFIGVRACELAAIVIQDRVLLGGLTQDPVYAARRGDVVLIAVNCAEPAGTCFCASMQTGPRVGAGADLTLTELIDPDDHRFVAEASTELGSALLAGLGGRDAGPEDLAAVDDQIEQSTQRMGRRMPTEGLPDLLMANLDHPRWDEVADRCTSCTNCTMVCPTCFCTQAEDVTELDGSAAHHDRRWDSCFSLDFSHMGEGAVRTTTRSRYRQWMTHKLSTWVDQFGTSGCVGCGRCIAWCPVGIDITEEVAAIAADPQELPS